MLTIKKTLPVLALAAALLVPAGAEATAYAGLSRSRLSDGIELYVYEDHAVPIARVEVAFRGGASVQTPDTAGLFHLYEHLVFGGDASSGGSASLRAELASLGAAEWNGGSSAERLDFWLSLPSDRVEGALRFWAGRLRPESIQASDIAAALPAILDETRSLDSTPDRIYEAAIEKRLFGKYPWRRDPAGSEAALKAATPEALARIRDAWIVPNNMALIVAGDVDPESVKALAEAAFAGWKAAADPLAKPLPAHPKPGVVRPTWMVYPDPTMPEGIAFVELRYRGPDLGADPKASYAADLWTALVDDGAGRFKTQVARNVPGLYGADPLATWYLSQREGSTLSISAYFKTDPAAPAVDRARAFKERVRGTEVATMRSDSSYFQAKDFEAAKKRLEDARRFSLETADGVADSLAWWWATASGDYFIGYSAALARTGPEEVGAFLDAYVMRNLEVIALRMNPADFEKERKSFANSGFDVVTQANAFWWQK